MDKNELNINEIKTNRELLLEKYELLEKENNKNKTIILNLETQLKLLRTEYMKKIRELEEKSKQQFQRLLNLILKNGENNAQKNEIILNDKSDDIININDIYSKLEQMVHDKFGVFQDQIFFLLGKSLKKEKENIEIKEDNLIDLYNKILYKIFIYINKINYII